MFRTIKIQKDILIIIGLLSLSYVLIFLLSPKDITDYTVADTEYWRETQNRLLLKTAYEYNSKEDLEAFPRNLSDWKGFDYRFPESTYKLLKADIVLSRTYAKRDGIVWFDIINSKTGESFHKQRICIEGSGWNIDKESIAEFQIAEGNNPFVKLYANRLDYSRKGEKQVMVYWFMFKKFGSKDAVSMVRVSSPVIYNETDTFNTIKNFIENELFKTMYKNAVSDTITMADDIVDNYGNTGAVAMAIAVLIPIGITIVGIRKKD